LFRSKPLMKAAPLAANCVLKSAALANCPCEALASAWSSVEPGLALR